SALSRPHSGRQFLGFRRRGGGRHGAVRAGHANARQCPPPRLLLRYLRLQAQLWAAPFRRRHAVCALARYGGLLPRPRRRYGRTLVARLRRALRRRSATCRLDACPRRRPHAAGSRRRRGAPARPGSLGRRNLSARGVGPLAGGRPHHQSVRRRPLAGAALRRVRGADRRPTRRAGARGIAPGAVRIRRRARPRRGYEGGAFLHLLGLPRHPDTGRQWSGAGRTRWHRRPLAQCPLDGARGAGDLRAAARFGWTGGRPDGRGMGPRRRADCSGGPTGKPNLRLPMNADPRKPGVQLTQSIALASLWWGGPGAALPLNQGPVDGFLVGIVTATGLLNTAQKHYGATGDLFAEPLRFGRSYSMAIRWREVPGSNALLRPNTPPIDSSARTHRC